MVLQLAAGQRGSPAATGALETLCRTYWYPLYAYIRRRGSRHEDAQNLNQGFLLQLLEHEALNRARQRYYELFREEIAHTVAHPGEIEDEPRYLCELIAG